MVRRICDDARIVQINEYSFDTGDTLIIDDLKDIPRRYPEIDLALLHLGGTRVLGIMVTMDAKQGVQMIRLIQPWRAIPIH